MKTNKLFKLIRKWAKEKGIYRGSNAMTQYVYAQSEMGELADALMKSDRDEIKDAIGDVIVCLTNVAKLSGLTVEECIEQAYNEIKGRTGKMVNGSFVKN